MTGFNSKRMMARDIEAGADIHAGDGGYEIGTKEDYEAFVRARYQIPPECVTEAEKTAFVFGWFKALEAQELEPKCKTHPDAPHGFVRNASHTLDRDVCECESWDPPENEEVMKILDVMWFCGRSNVGIVRVDDEYEGNRYYIGSPPSSEIFPCSIDADKHWIADWGSTFPKTVGDRLFGVDEVDNGLAVQIPQNKEQAIAMVKIGLHYLEQQ